MYSKAPKAATATSSTYAARPCRHNTLGSLDWEAETKETWGIFRDAQIQLCEKCRTKGVGATAPVNVMRPPVLHKGKMVDYLGWDWVYLSLLSKIRSAGFGGCAFCMVLYLGFRQLERAEYGSECEPSGRWDFRYALQSPRCVRVGAVHPTDGDGEVVEQFYITVENEDSVSGQDNPIGPQTMELGSTVDRFLGMARGLIKKQKEGRKEDKSIIRPDWVSFMRMRMYACLSSADHDLCRQKPNFKVEWPKRILKVTGDRVTLMDFHQTMAGEYAALSYCWGSEDDLKQNPPLKATTSSSGRLRSGIPISDLALTSRQALAVCSCLGIKYIWVDALCIIQDDNADWEAEAQKMATVYSMAKVTIIAASSTSCHSGFLDISPDGEILELPGDLNFNLPARLVRRSSTSTFHFKKDDFVNFDPTDVETPAEPQDAIDHRGWTFQEEFLSTRYIKFTKNDIQWQCREDAGCICYQGVQKHERRAVYEDLWNSTPPAPSKSRRHQSAASEPTADLSFHETSRGYWQETVQDFSCRQFTNSRDKLLAFSGVATRLAPNMQSPYIDSTYIAGLWRNMLSDGGALSWRCHENAKACPYDTYIAPSFSWVSVRGGVTYDQGSKGRAGFQDERRLFELVDAERALISSNEEFGRVSAGCSVTLAGALYPCSVSYRIVGYGNQECPTVGDIAGPNLQAIASRTWFDCGVSRVMLADGKVTLQRCRENLAFERTEVHILILQSMTFYDGDGSGFDGLILGKVTGRGGTDGYQRLGYIRVMGKELDMQKYRAVVTIY